MGSNLLMLAELASQIVGIALLPDSIAQDFIKIRAIGQSLPEWTAHMVFSMQFIHHVGVYCQRFVYLSTIWLNNYPEFHDKTRLISDLFLNK